MGTEILRPQDCLIQGIKFYPCRRRNNNKNNNYYNYYGNSYANPPKYYYDSNSRFNRKAAAVVRSDQRKRQSEQSLISKRSNPVDDLKISKSHCHNSTNHGYKNNSHNFVMEKVTILRRGESLDSKIQNSENAAALKKDHSGELVATGTNRLGPGPEVVPKQTRIVDLRSPVNGKCDVYAGSAFAVSPAPSSLPLPSFSKKKQVSFDDSASRDLRRLLRLDA